MLRNAGGWLNIILLLQGLSTCTSWFYYGDISWYRDSAASQMVHFTLNTAWDKRGLPETFARVSAAEDVMAFNADWLAAVGMGKGGILNITEGSSADVKRRIYFTDTGASLPTNGSRFNFIITGVDARAVHATLRFSHNFSNAGTFDVVFEGCCRSFDIANNQGNAWHLKSTVMLLADGPIRSPRLTLPAFLSLPEPTAQSPTTFSLGAVDTNTSMISYWLGNTNEMGYGFEHKVGGPWNRTFYSDAGASLSMDGVLTLTDLEICGTSSQCILQMTVIISTSSGSAAIDFMIILVTNPQPMSTYMGFMVTPASTPHAPVTIHCNSSHFYPPVRTTYLISECVDISEVGTFQCAGYSGICPSADHAFVSPFSSPLYSSCFTAERCQGGKQRLYCTDLAETGVSNNFLRVAFAPAGSELAVIRQVTDLPTTATVLPTCDPSTGDCAGVSFSPSGQQKFVDVTWTPKCEQDIQLGLHAFCFLATDINGTDSQPSCVYVNAVDNSENISASFAAISLEASPSLAVETQQPAAGNEEHVALRLVIYRQPAHAVAQEAFLIQPQIAVVDELGSRSSITVPNAVSLAIGRDPDPAGSILSGTTTADVVNGMAVFTDLKISAEGHGFTLKVQAKGLGVTSIETPRFIVLPAVKAMQIGTQTPETVAAGHYFGASSENSPKIFLFDQDGNYAALSSKVITVSLLKCSSPESCSHSTELLSGVTTVSAVQGIAQFHDLSVSTVGAYRLQFGAASGDPAVDPINSRIFTIVAGLPAVVLVTQQPCANPCEGQEATSQVAKDTFETAIKLIDSYGNDIQDSRYSTTVSLNRFSTFAHSSNLLCCERSEPDCILPCNTTTDADGTATWNDLFIKEQGFFSITFTVFVPHIQGGITNTTLVFDVQLPVNRVEILNQPGLSFAGQFIAGAHGQPLAVELLDEYAFRTESRRPVSVELDVSNATSRCAATCHNATACRNSPNSTCEQPATVIGKSQFNAVSGQIVFAPSAATGITVNRAGSGYTLQIRASSTAFTFTGPFEVSHATPSNLVVSRQPLDVYIGEPFSVQPVVAVVDSFANLATTVSGTITAFSTDDNSSSIFLTGLVTKQVVDGQASFHNLILDSEDLIDHITTHQLRFWWDDQNLTAFSTLFDAQPGLGSMGIVTAPKDLRAGETLDGPPTANLTTTNSQPYPTFLQRAISIRLDESLCPERYPPAQLVPAQITQVEIRGHSPIGVGQVFALNNFVTVGISSPQELNVTIIDAAQNCNNSNLVPLNGGEHKSIICFDDSNCSTAATEHFLAFTINSLPPSGSARLCAQSEGQHYLEVAFVLSQGVTSQLHTVLPIVEKTLPPHVYKTRGDPLDNQFLWYAGTAVDEVDDCQGFGVSTSDPRIAFVLSREDVFNSTFDYKCPKHPETMLPYRWASSSEVVRLNTVFNGHGSSTSLYAGACGNTSDSLQDGRTSFFFQDSGASGRYVVMGLPETQGISADPMLLASAPAGLVCILDDPHFDCLPDCPDVPCPPAQAESPVVGLEEDQELLLRVVFYKERPKSPLLESAVLPEAYGNQLVMSDSEIGFKLSLLTEPASWVTVRAMASSDPDLVSWDTSTDYVFGSHLWDLHSAGAYAFDDAPTHNISCVDDCSAWPFNKTVILRYVLYSTVPAYNGTTRTIQLRRSPPTPASAAAFFSREPAEVEVVTGSGPTAGVGQSGEQEDQQDNRPLGLFCIREAAHWPVGGEAASVSLVGNVKWCGENAHWIVAGGYHTCSVVQTSANDQNVLCWGRNNTGQTGVPRGFRAPLGQDDVVALGTFHTCAVDVSGILQCWGDRSRGILDVPQVNVRWSTVSCGSGHSCGLEVNGTAYCWGDSQYGQTFVPSDALWKSISCGNFHSCGIRTDGHAECWGAVGYYFGQTTVPEQDVLVWRKISAGNQHTCGILQNSSAICWGGNSFGQATVPYGLEVLWWDISAGLRHSCGILLDRSMVCWGDQGENRLQVLPTIDGPWSKVSAGYDHTCGRYENGRISCWGSQQHGKLAVSAVHPVDFSPPGPVVFDAMSGLSPASNHTGFVDVTLSVNTTSQDRNHDPTIKFKLIADSLQGNQETYLANMPIRLDISAQIEAWAVSNDVQLAESEYSEQRFTVTASDPVLSPTDSANGTEYETQVLVNITADKDFNPYSDTEIYFAVHNGNPHVPLQKYYQSILVGNNTANENGTTLIKAVAVRTGALNSSTVEAVYVTRAAPPLLMGNANISVMKQGLDGRGMNISLKTQTADGDILYSICRPSSCTSPSDPRMDDFVYSGPFFINETNTTLKAITTKSFLATSFVSTFFFELKLERPKLFPASNPQGYLAPLPFEMHCPDLTTGFYSLDGAVPSIEYSGPVLLYRDHDVRAVCRRNFMETSDESTVSYHITVFEILQANISESTQVQSAPNRITLNLKTTRVLSVGTEITLTGLVGTQTGDNQNLPLSSPRLSGRWKQDIGELVVNVTEALPSGRLLFAKTSSTACAESLQYGPDQNFEDPYLSTYNLDVKHKGWTQEWTAGGQPWLTIEYHFHEICTLGQRLALQEGSQCDAVDWLVTDHLHNRTEFLSGRYAFSDGEHLEQSLDAGSGCCLAADDGAWGAVAGSAVLANGRRFPTFWGQGVFDNVDTNPGQCDTLYFGAADESRPYATQRYLQHPDLQSLVYLTQIESELLFSFDLQNPASNQSAVSVNVSLSGKYADALGLSLQNIGPKPVFGNVLTAVSKFGLSQIVMTQSSSDIGAENTVAFSFLSNLPIPDNSLMIVSNLAEQPPTDPDGKLFVGVSAIPETASSMFECIGFRSCSVMIADYVPQNAVAEAVTVEILLACSDFNSGDERITELVIGSNQVSTYNSGPWDGCEAACGTRQTVLQNYDARQFQGNSFTVSLTASPAVDAYSCSDSSTILVDARVSVSVSYYYPTDFTSAHSVSYILNDLNLQPGCRDRIPDQVDASQGIVEWTDSAGYGCQDYDTFGWCTESTCGTQQSWTCDQYRSGGLAANDVCCVCGAGTRYWTNVAFKFRNPASQSKRPRVSVQDPIGAVLFNITMPEPIGASDVGSNSSGSARRRLLSDSGDNSTMPQANTTANVSWVSELAVDYSCCWSQTVTLLRRAVAESAVVLVNDVEVQILERYPLHCVACTGFLAAIKIRASSQEDAVAIANNMQGTAIAKALLSKKLQVRVVLQPAMAFGDDGSQLILTSEQSLGNHDLGDRFTGNFADFPEQTQSSYGVQWQTGRVLVGETTELATGGMVLFNQSRIFKSCAYYKLDYYAVISNSIRVVSSGRFIVRHGVPDSLAVSPVPTLGVGAWPCWDAELCTPVKIVAGLSFAVTATVLDVYNNTCTEVAGYVAASMVNTSTEVFAISRAPMAEGSVTIYIKILNSGLDYVLKFVHFDTMLTNTSNKFEVLPGPLASLWISSPEGGESLTAGSIFDSPPMVELYDSYWNLVHEKLQVAMSLLDIADGLQGSSATVISVNGTATFSDARVVHAGANIQAVFSSGGVSNVSRAFSVDPQVVTESTGGSLRLLREAANGVAGEVLTVQPQVQVRDRFGNQARTQQGQKMRVDVRWIGVDACDCNTIHETNVVDGVAEFTDVAVGYPGSFALDFFMVGISRVNLTMAQTIEVSPTVARMEIISAPPESVLAGECVEPAFQLLLLDQHNQSVDFSRREIGVDLAVSTFRFTQFFSCGSGGCSASSTFRYYLPTGATLVDAFLNVDVIKTDYDEEGEIVEHILLNGVRAVESCNPDAANDCFSYFSCLKGGDVTSLAAGNFLTVTVKISASVNDFCAPRLQARAQLYGSYRPAVPETAQIAGTTSLVPSGRTVEFNGLRMPISGFGYRLRFFSGNVAVVSDRFDVLQVAERLVFQTQPADAIAGEPFGIQPLVNFLDSFDNLVSSVEASLTIEVAAAENFVGNIWNPVSVTLSASDQINQITTAASGGMVKFQGLTVDLSVERVTLRVSTTDLTLQEVSAPFAVAPPVQILDPSEIITSLRAGIPGLGKITLQDASGATAELSRATIGVIVVSGPGFLSGTTTAVAKSGQADFSNITFNVTGTYSLRFQAPGLPLGPMSSPVLVNVAPSSPAGIEVVNASRFTSVDLFAGFPFEVQVRLIDKFGNPSPSGSMTATAEPVGWDDSIYAADSTSIEIGDGKVTTGMSSGTANFFLRIDSAGVRRVRFRVALSPEAACSLDNVTHGCHPPYTSSTVCSGWQMSTGMAGCHSIALCAYFPSDFGACEPTCDCSGNVRSNECHSCVVSADLDLNIRADRQGSLRIQVQTEPDGAINNQALDTQPSVLVETSFGNPVENVAVTVTIASAVDECTLIGLPFCVSLGGTLSANSGSNGIAQFTDLRVTTGIDGATQIVLQFVASNGARNDTAFSSSFSVGGQPNTAPQIVFPSPLLCNDAINSETIPVAVGSSRYWTFRAEDNNSAPFDDVMIQFEVSGVGLPPNSYFTEDLYDHDNTILQSAVAECSEIVNRTRQLKNRVERVFFWNSVGWFPDFSITYKAIEANRTGQFAGIEAAQSCDRTLFFRVCDRPRFVSPSPIGTGDTMVVLAMTELVFTVAAEDRNAEDVVQIRALNEAELVDMGVQIGDQEHQVSLQVDGLNETSFNRALRQVTWQVPSGPPRSTHTMCFDAVDNDFSCGPLTSENMLCMVCTIDPYAVYATCIPELRAEALDTRSHSPVCGDARVTGTHEQCDDGNHESGDGCSSMCRIEEGWRRLVLEADVVNICGDGRTVNNTMIAESCDDANLMDGDGCSSSCAIEEGWDCLECGTSSKCRPICGDGLLKGVGADAEQCDDSNEVSGDGCSSQCTIESGWRCPGKPLPCIDPGCPPCTVPEPICGDFVVQVGYEECDNGPNGGGGCTANCTTVRGFICEGEGNCTADCGDGRTLGLEECDDGEASSSNGDGCSTECTIEDFFGCIGSHQPLAPILGSGIIRSNWSDASPSSQDYTACDEICGDGVKASDHLECDDGNNRNGDGCSAFCKIEDGWLCEVGQPCRPDCGDGIRFDVEECDDGNQASADGCSSSCTIEAAYDCVMGTLTAEARMMAEPTSCLSLVENGEWYCYSETANASAYVSQPEQTCLNRSSICFQGTCANTMGFSREICYLMYTGQTFFRSFSDVVSNRPELESVVWNTSDICSTNCGDGIRASAEECDDNNTLPNDGCSPSCKIEQGWYCLRGSPDSCSSICGDGVLVSIVEECDDGAWSETKGDGCTDKCVLEPGFVCRYDSKNKTNGGCIPAACGDGLWVKGEACDDGNQISSDGCSDACTIEEGWVCGPSTETGSTFRSICGGIHGDNILVSGEECEDGNVLNGDGCSSSGLIEPGYDCTFTDGVGGRCRTVCGDGVRVGRETCDDNNQNDGDGCSKDCLIEHGWQCIAADCGSSAPGGRCAVLEGAPGSYCEQCPPLRYVEVRCSHPPCPEVELTADCQNWRMYEDGGWRRVSEDTGGIESDDCHPEWEGDGYCDPVNNNAKCQYDGGDCCEGTCRCSVAGYNPCFNGTGCGSFSGQKGDFNCLDPSAASAPSPVITLSKSSPTGIFLSSVEVAITISDPEVEIFFTLDGSEPAVQTAGATVTGGEAYSGPFEATSSLVVKAASVLRGYRIGNATKNLVIQVEPPRIVPTPARGERLPSPVIVEIFSQTPDATLRYTVITSAGSQEFTYDTPFALVSSANVSAIAVKEGEALDSTTSFASFILEVAQPIISPSNDSTFTTAVEVSISTPTDQATTLYSVCNGSEWPRWANKSLGEINQRPGDTCYPTCLGVCEGGGAAAGSVCANNNDGETCGTGVCRQSYKQVRLCYPNEWIDAEFTYTYNGPFILNSSNGGSNSVITAWSSKTGLVSSPLSSVRYLIQTSAPTLNVTAAQSPPLAVSTKADLGPFLLGSSFLYFNTTTPTALVYYTLNETYAPTLPPNSNTFVYDTAAPMVVELLKSATVRAVARAANLIQSEQVEVTIAVQAPTPSVRVSDRHFDFIVGIVVGGVDDGALQDAVVYPSLGFSGTAPDPIKLGLDFGDYGLSFAMYYKVTPGIDQALDFAISYEEPGLLTADILNASWNLFVDTVATPAELTENSTLRVVGISSGALPSAVMVVPFFIRRRCSAGSVSVNNDGLEPCSECPHDFYRKVDSQGVFVCEACPPETFTVSAGSSSEAMCLAQCGPGTNSSTGLNDTNSIEQNALCDECGFGFYQPNHRSVSCIRCPAGLNTLSEGSTSISDCRGVSFINAGGFHSCGITSAGRAVCWGYNGFGQLDIPREFRQWQEDGLVRTGYFDYTWKSLTAGSFHSCGVTAAGTALCWGQEFAGKTAIPREVFAWKALSASPGYHHTCGISSDGSAHCWGDNEYGQAQVPPGHEWHQLSAGQFHTCGVSQSGNALCWGDNSYDQSNVPQEETPWRSISSGHYHSCGVLITGDARCWGSGLYEATRIPLEVELWSTISVGRFHSCGVTADGALRCWGSNQDGALNYPSHVSSWATVNTGLFHSCGTDATGAGYCWGRTVYGVTVVPQEQWQLA